MRNLKLKADREDVRYTYRYEIGPAEDKGGTQYVEAEVYYDLGGHNPFSGKVEPRGISLSIKPITVSEGCIRFAITADPRKSGLRAFVLELKRRNDRRLAMVAEALDDLVPAICENWLSDHGYAKTLLGEAKDGARRRLGEFAPAPRAKPSDAPPIRRQKLLTDDIRMRIPRLYGQDGVPVPDKVVHVKFFTPTSNWTWYATEGEPVNANGESLAPGDAEADFKFFGYVEGIEGEWGYFLLSELEAVKGPFGLGVERDKFFGPVRMGEVRALAGAL